jgi:hypothetical protein
LFRIGLRPHKCGNFFTAREGPKQKLWEKPGKERFVMQDRFKVRAIRWAVVGGLLMLLSITSMGYVQAAGLTPEEAAKLAYIREEEKLARDVYKVLYNLYNVRIFKNIAASEQTHMDAIKTLLDRYGIPDPADAEDGKFSPESGLQTIYNNLITQGQISLIEAFKVGVAIEKMDIEDLKEGIDISKHKDITTVYKNLLKGSENHLAAFEYNL